MRLFNSRRTGTAAKSGLGSPLYHPCARIYPPPVRTDIDQRRAMNTCPLFVSSVLWPVVLLGCLGCSDTSRQTPVSAEPQPNAVVSGSESDRPQAGESFGIPNDFSGKLTEEQERHVPDALQGAFSI